MVVVHPAYWRRGHGTTLVNWGKSLADLDRIGKGVVAADMGEKLYASLGYQKLDEVSMEDITGPSPHNVSVGILKYDGSIFERAELWFTGND
jgi:N-acetylglutamate synthase-like GNAT family acetyltransferase